MNKGGPIVIIEDDPDDQLIFGEILKKFNHDNEVVFFEDGNLALDYLMQTAVKPFLIISDINMPKLNGFILRDMIHENEQLRLKCTPYLFFTTATSEKFIIEAYSRSIQGFFIKPNSIAVFETLLKKIIDYWQNSKSPDQL